MKILLTGACGLVGRAILRAGGDDHSFVQMDVAQTVESAGGVRASVTDLDAVLRAAEGCDAIIHTAALHGGHRGKASNQEFIRTNVIGAENLFEAARRQGIRRVVMSSTMEVLCGGEWGSSGITVYDHRSPPRPDWIYPATKLLAEELGHFHARCSGLEVVQLRYMWVRRVGIEKIGQGLLARSVADSDVAQANLLSATTPGLKDEVFLIGPDTPLEMADVVQAQRDPWAVLERYWPGCTPILRAAGVELDPAEFWPVARIDHARQLLGWRPKVTFEKYLKLLGWTGTTRAGALTVTRGGVNV